MNEEEKEYVNEWRETNLKMYEKLRSLNVTGHIEQKNGLNYLSWAWAWDEVMKLYPEAIYEIERFDNKPYLYDEKAGYMVFTKIKIQDMEREMWLPVMDSNNKAMLDHEYIYKTKYGEKKVESATMFDINKTIMRCLVKNLAMFGLGLALYSGEDLPEEELTEKEAKEYKFGGKKHPNKTIMEVLETDPDYLQWWLDNGKDERVKQMITLLTGMIPTPIPSEEEQQERYNLLKQMQDLIDKTNTDYEAILKHFGVESNSEMSDEQMKEAIKIMESKL